MEPATKPRKGCKPSTFAIATPSASCISRKGTSAIQKPQQPRPAARQQAQVRCQAQTRKEQQQQVGTRRVRQRDAEPSGAHQQRGGDREQDPADHRTWDTVALENRDALTEEGADQQYDTGGEQGRQRVEADQTVRDCHARPTSADIFHRPTCVLTPSVSLHSTKRRTYRTFLDAKYWVPDQGWSQPPLSTPSDGRGSSLSRTAAAEPQQTTEQLQPHLSERLHSTDRDAAWIDRSGSRPDRPDLAGAGRGTGTAGLERAGSGCCHSIRLGRPRSKAALRERDVSG